MTIYRVGLMQGLHNPVEGNIATKTKYFFFLEKKLVNYSLNS